MGGEKNPPIFVYDCSGPYTDPEAKIDIRHGLPAAARRMDRGARRHRGAVRPDVRIRPSSAPTRSEAGATALPRPAPQAAPRQARHERDADALRAPGHRHAGDGIHRHPREPAARGTTWKRCEASGPHGREAGRADEPPASGPDLRRRHPGRDHARIRARRSRARPRHHPRQHQPPGIRADDHRPQLPGEDQRQHRQLGARLLASARKSRR